MGSAFALEIAAVEAQVAQQTSLDGDRLPKSVGRCAAQPVLAAIFEDQLDRCAKTLSALLQGTALPIGSGDLRRPSDKPFAIALDYGSEFVPHAMSIARNDKAEPPYFAASWRST